MYTASPHDLTKWCSGILRYSYESGADTDKFLLEIVFYEALHVFGDKLTTELEKNKLRSLVSNNLEKIWNFALSDILYVATPQFGSTNKGYPLSKMSTNEWSNYISKGIQIYGSSKFWLAKTQKKIKIHFRTRRPKFEYTSYNRTASDNRQTSKRNHQKTWTLITCWKIRSGSQGSTKNPFSPLQSQIVYTSEQQ